LKTRTLGTLAAAFGFLAAPAAHAGDYPQTRAGKSAMRTAENTNQVLADKVATKLSDSAVAYDADVSLHVADGVLTVTGSCRSPMQKQEILSEVRVVDGITLVRDGLKVESQKIVQMQQVVGHGLCQLRALCLRRRCSHQVRYRLATR